MKSDTTRDRRTLRGVEKLGPRPTSTPSSAPSLFPSKPTMPSADGSGLIDLDALMAAQPQWLDEALARAKASHDPDSISPIALTKTPHAAAPPAKIESVPGRPKRYVSAFVVAASSVTLAAAVTCVIAFRGHWPKAARVASNADPVNASAPAVNPAHVEPELPTTEEFPETPPPPDPAPLAHARAPEAILGKHSKPAPRGHHAPRSPSPHAAAPAAPIASPEPAEPVAARPPSDQSGAAAGALDSALRAAAGKDSAAAPALAPPPSAAIAANVAAPAPVSGRPERPSGSVVTSALTQALPAARACVAGDTEPSRASITFQSDGSVKKVDLTGPAASDPSSAGCLRKAFREARVPPFSQVTYAVGVTVRPR